MEYIKKDLGAYNLHLINTNKFKSITVKVIFREPIIKEDITIRNVLCDLFMSSSKNYPSKRDLVIKAQDLYGASFNVKNGKQGNYVNTEFTMSMLNDKYTEVGNYEEGIKFLLDILFNPDVEESSFKKDKIDIIKNIATNAIKSAKDHPSSYALSRMAEEFDSSSVVSYNMLGYLDDLDNVNGENLYQYYLNMLNTNLVDVFVIGNIDIEENVSLFKSLMKIDVFKKEKITTVVDSKKVRSKLNIVKEENNTSQSNLAIGYVINDIDAYERNYALTLFNVIFGGGFDSKLFKNVREKHSLCYYISSVANKLDNMLVVRAGIDANNFDKTISLIEENFKEMIKGDFTDEDINVAKETYLTALDEVLENPNYIINDYFMKLILDTDDIDTKRKKIMDVTKEELIAVAKKIKIDTVYLLEGIDNE